MSNVNYQVHSYESFGTIECILQFGTIDCIYAFNRTKITLVLRKYCTPLFRVHTVMPSVFLSLRCFPNQKSSVSPEDVCAIEFKCRPLIGSVFISMARRLNPVVVHRFHGTA